MILSYILCVKYVEHDLWWSLTMIFEEKRSWFIMIFDDLRSWSLTISDHDLSWSSNKVLIMKNRGAILQKIVKDHDTSWSLRHDRSWCIMILIVILSPGLFYTQVYGLFFHMNGSCPIGFFPLIHIFDFSIAVTKNGPFKV